MMILKWKEGCHVYVNLGNFVTTWVAKVLVAVIYVQYILRLLM